MEKEDWKCPRCGGINPSKRSNCLGCNNPKQSEELMNTPEFISGIGMTTTLQRAKEIFGEKNVFGPKEWMKYFHYFIEENQNEVNKIPWNEVVLRSPGINQPHFLFLGIKDMNGKLLNINRWNYIFPKDTPRFYRQDSTLGYSSVYSTERSRTGGWEDYLGDDFCGHTCDFRWYLMPVGIVKDSNRRSYDQQISMLPNEYEVPSAIERITGNFLYYMLNGKYLDKHRGRSRDLTNSGERVIVGFSSGLGLLFGPFASDDTRCDAGVVASRKPSTEISDSVIKIKQEAATPGLMDHLDKDKTPLAVQQSDCIGVRFDIGKISSGGYGEECWKVFWKVVDPKMLAGSQLLEGDTNGTPDWENVYCLAVKWTLGTGRGDDVRKALEESEEYQRVAAQPNFIDTSQVNKEPLVDGGQVDRSGNLVGGNYRALPALNAVHIPIPATPAIPVLKTMQEVNQKQATPIIPATLLAPEEKAISAAKSKAANKKVFIILGIIFVVTILFAILCSVITSIGNNNGSVATPMSLIPILIQYA